MVTAPGWIISLFITISLDRCWSSKYNTLQENNRPEAYSKRFASQCFHIKGVPSVNLKCPDRQLIRVEEAFFGVPPLNNTCWYKPRESHCTRPTDMPENCNGRQTCSVPVSNPFLLNCLTFANYMQVNYTCIPVKETQDICKEAVMTTRRGFLRTPRYPDRFYYKKADCKCDLKTTDQGILLQILDMAINHTVPGDCNSDFLRIYGWGKKCGTIAPYRLPEKLEVNDENLSIEFQSDSIYEGRGFWLEYSGSEGGKVTTSCQSLSPVTPDVADVDNNIASDNTNILIDDTGAIPIFNSPGSDVDETAFDTYDFNDSQESFAHEVDKVQIATSVVIAVLILIAITIIIVLILRR